MGGLYAVVFCTNHDHVRIVSDAQKVLHDVFSCRWVEVLKWPVKEHHATRGEESPCKVQHLAGATGQLMGFLLAELDKFGEELSQTYASLKQCVFRGGVPLRHHQSL